MLKIQLSILFLTISCMFCSHAWSDPLSLFSDEELSRLQHTEAEWSNEIHRYNLDQKANKRFRKMATRSFEPVKDLEGPQISILNPILTGDHYRTPIPVRLLVYLKNSEASIDIESFNVKGKRGIFTLNITNRIKGFIRQPFEGEDAAYVIDANIPKIGAGRYLIIMSIADVEGNKSEHQAFLEVEKK